MDSTTGVFHESVPFHPASSPDYVPVVPLRRLQSERLRQTVSRVYEHVAFYRQRMHKHGVAPVDVHSVDDIGRLPFTTKDDLRHAYPFGMFAVPIDQVAGLHPPSGLTDKPIVLAYTRRDLEMWTEVIVRCLACCGVRRGDIIQNGCGYNLFTDGLGLHYGAERLGAVVIPISGGDTDHQIMVMRDFGVSAICCTPSYLLYLIERAERLGVDLRQLPLRAAVLVAEPYSEAMRARIEEAAGIKAYEVYGSPEVLGLGVGAECPCQNGLHVLEDHFFPEIVDPATGEPLPEGEEGELVLTTLSRDAMPLLRYRTGDLTALLADPCPCGRTLRRIRRVGRRRGEMFVIEGVEVYVSQVEAALLAVEGTLPHYQIMLTQQEGLDQAEVRVEVTRQVLSDRVGALERLQHRLEQEILRATGVAIPVRLVEPQTIERQRGKGPRIVDTRND
ncbi:MAG TPA: phenylacetate--CoA ligase family protein [Planctomycetes bacterium]|nr:phenylacetate--CoA ligase family protein [Planctomycetota bacterium]